MSMLRSLRGNLSERFPTTGKRLASARLIFDRIFDTAEKIEAGVGKIRADRNLTDAGHADAIKKFLANPEITSSLALNSRIVDALHAAIDGRRQRTITPPKTNPESAALHVEMRAIIREKGTAFLTDPKTDRDFIEAALEAPNLMTGIDDQRRADIGKAYAERFHAADLREITEAENAFQMIDIAIRVAFDTVKAVGGFASHQAAKEFIAERVGPDKAKIIESGAASVWRDFATAGATGA
jgi:hypothetical protein